MKIKQRTEVTVVTHEITLLRIRNDEGGADVHGEPAVTHPSDDSQTEIDSKGNEYEKEEIDS